MNASPSPPAGSPHSWLAHAKSDLRITQICRSDSGVLPNQTVFHAQQAAEKAIKAVLLEHKIRFPRTHDLGELIVLIQQHAVMWPFAPDEVEAGWSRLCARCRSPEESGDYFFFAISPNQSVTAFRSEIGQKNLAGLSTNLRQIQGSTTTDAQYQRALAQFRRRPDPPGQVLNWVCRDNLSYLDLTENRLEMDPD